MATRVLKVGRTFEVRLTPEEAAAVDDMKRSTGETSDENIALTALWRHSEHLEMNLPLRARLFEARRSKART